MRKWFAPRWEVVLIHDARYFGAAVELPYAKTVFKRSAKSLVNHRNRGLNSNEARAVMRRLK